MTRLFSILAFLFVAGALVVAAGFFTLFQWAEKPLKLEEDTVLAIQPGDTLSKISYQMTNDGWLSHPRLLTVLARLTERTRVEVGEYQLKAHMTPEEFLNLLQSGEVITYSVTLVEGKTFKEFLARLKTNPSLVDDWQEKTFEDFVKENGLPLEHPEGWFYPDTYQFVKGTSISEILLRAYQRMSEVLEQEWQAREKGLPYETPYEALIMASIVEKETAVASERDEIAGVFVRRLQKGMRLQTDPTIIYGLGDSYKGNIRRKHLTQYTPYNTYVINGLPPTPIAMPAREAIHASLHPKAGDSLYFVAKGDGTHQFSATYAEHNRAVQEYQIQKRAKNYQSVPQ